MVVMTTPGDGPTAIGGWTDDEIAADGVRAAGVLYAAATLEELKLIELVEHLNELNQGKLLSIGAGPASNLLHGFWDQGYKRMPARRRTALFARVLGAPGGDDDADSNRDFPELLERLVAAIADGEPDAVAPAAAALRDNLAAHTDEQSTKAARELRATLAEIGEVLSDMELRSAFGAADMWQLVESFQREHGGGPDVPRTRALASGGEIVLRALPELCAQAAPGDEVVAAARQWLPANAAAA
jgi:hypothetical protein